MATNDENQPNEGEEELDNSQASQDQNLDNEEQEEAADDQGDQDAGAEGADEEGEEGEEGGEEPKAQPSRRESLRIQQLVNKLKQRTPQAGGSEEETLDYRTALDADDEVITKLENDREAYGRSRESQAIRRAEAIEWKTMLHIDSPKVTTKYPQFDPESDQFNPVVANAINEWYLQTSGYNPKTETVANSGVRYSEFVEGIMELADEMAGAQVQKTSKNLAGQAAKTGLRPDGSSAKRLNLNKPPEQMSDEELAAVIAQAIPKK